MDEQEFEHIPWSRLVAEEDGRRRQRFVYLAIGAAAAAVAGFIGIRWFLGPDHGTTPTAAAVVTTAIAAPTTTSTTVPPSEADLRAPVEPGDDALAMMRAEWFVTDFFTVDGDPAQLAAIEEAFAAGVDAPLLPHEEPERTSVNYVEWARAYDVESVADGTFAVDVAYRLIGDDGTGHFTRSAVRAVQVLVMAGDGASAVADLPTPIPPPGAAEAFAVRMLEGKAAVETAEAALRYARSFDETAELVSISAEGDAWRAVVLVDGGAGIRFPVSVSTALIP